MIRCFFFKTAVVISMVFTSYFAIGADCSKYLGRGYCTDYIQVITGSTQGGNAKDWVSNIEKQDVAVGDVAIFTLGAYGHVAFVESVRLDDRGAPQSVDLSEWNYSKEYVDPDCVVTSSFGITTKRRNVSLNTISGFWRAEGNLAVDRNIVTTVVHGDIDWAPGSAARCEEAESWWIRGIKSGSDACREVVQFCNASTPEAKENKQFQSWWRKVREYFSSSWKLLVPAAQAQACLYATTNRTIHLDVKGNIANTIRGNGVSYYDFVGNGGGRLTADPPAVQNLPDLVTKKVWLETPWGFETYKYGRPETMKMKAQFANVGSGDVPPGSLAIEVHFYLSKGYKEDSHSGDGHWTRVGTDYVQPYNLRVGDTHTETEGIELWRDIPEPGIWNIVACIDHVRDDHNNGGAISEKHESNNCSTEAVFEVTADGKVVNVPDVDFVTSGLHFRGAPPVYAGDRAHFGATITNQGTVPSPADIRSDYRVQCPGTGLIFLADDGTPANALYAGASAFEENIGAVTLPNVAGKCTAFFRADYQGAVQETNETNNMTSLEFVLQPRPAPRLVITNFKDESGCCTTNTGSRIKPDIWVRNDGPVSPASNVTVIYQINSPVATGGAWQTIGYGTIEPRELPPGKTDEDYMNGSWSIPKSSAWKNQWHTIRACIRTDGSAPAGDPGRGDICASYTRYSKK